MMKFPRAAARLTCLLLAIASPAAVVMTTPSPAHAFQPDRLSEAMKQVWARNYDGARATASRAGDPVAVDIVDWYRLRAGQADWSEYVRFLTANADWPGLELMRRRAEGAMPGALPADQVLAFFSVQKPQTGRGAMIYAGALGGQAGAAERARAWTDLPMSGSDRANFLERFGKELAPHHVTRLHNMLWSGETEAAEAMLPLVPGPEAALARARIALQRQAPGVDTLIDKVPAALAGDGGLAHDRFEWRMSKGRWDGGEELILAQSTSAQALGRPEAWSNRRRSLARDAMRDLRVQEAYRIASRHYLTSGSDYADLEWLSGYLALVHLGDAATAVQHFQRFQAAVETPISLGRAGYWLGRAHEATGNIAAARTAYAQGARHQTTFYGQLAAERAGIAPDQEIVQRGLPEWQNRGFARSKPVHAARLLLASGDTVTATRFLLHVQESLGPDDSAALARLSLELGQTAVAVRIAKRIAREGAVWPDAYYPLTGQTNAARGIPPELAMSIARQESEMNPAAISPAGARGLMQLMPGTAKLVAGDLGLSYSQARLTSDPDYNVQLGSRYLAMMLDRFDGSVILAAASYNAGPQRADEWIRRFGDPRTPGVDPVLWTEMIPFRETRNYVQRIAESMHVYRSRIAGQAGPIGLSHMLGAPLAGPLPTPPGAAPAPAPAPVAAASTVPAVSTPTPVSRAAATPLDGLARESHAPDTTRLSTAPRPKLR